MELYIGIFIGFFLGWFFTRIVDVIDKKRQLDKLNEMIDEKIEEFKEKVIPSRIEESNGLLLLYNSETNEFLGQGRSADELESTVKARYPGKLFNIKPEQLDKYFKDAK